MNLDMIGKGRIMMIVEFIRNHVFASSIAFVGVFSIFLQWLMTLSLKGYVKASANMKTTKKKVMINLKNQFETIYETNSQVHNMDAYVDKYLLKLRFIGATYASWEKLPFLTAGIVTLLAGVGAYYGYLNGAESLYYAEIVFACGITLACLFTFFHIFGIKTRKQQIHIQLVDYLENYLANRLIKNGAGKDKWQLTDEEMETVYAEGRQEALKEASEPAAFSNTDLEQRTSVMEEDMDMLKRLIREMDAKRESEATVSEVAVASEEQSDIELLEEFVQSFLS